MRSTLSIIVLLVVTTLVAAASLEARPRTATAAPEAYAVDGGHSAVVFRIKHIGVSYTYGRFNDIEGTIQFDPEAPEATSFDVTVKTESVDTAVEGRDRHLRSADFFNAPQFPEISFVSTAVKKGSAEGHLDVTGDLTLHGVTKSITVDMEVVGHGVRGRFGERAGFETVFTINRSDYGMSWGVDNGSLGDDVRLMVSLEAMKE